MAAEQEQLDRDAYRAIAEHAPVGTRIPLEVRVTVPDPFQAYLNARSLGPGVFLETTGGQEGWGYFGVDPTELLTVNEEAYSRRDGESPSLAAVAGLLSDESLTRGECEVPFPCGLFGWISYDVARELEDLPEETRNERRLPQVQFGLFDRVVAWKEPRSEDMVEVYITACPRLTKDPNESFEVGRERITSLLTAMESQSTIPDPGTTTNRVTFTSDCGEEQYAQRVRTIKQHIRDGDTFQVNISHRLRAPAAVSSPAVFSALRRGNPAPYSGLVEFPGIDLISASPELLLSIDSNRLLTEPIAGTRPRGATAEADEALAAELLDDEKERAEHALLVDLERNDLGKVSAYGSVDVTEYRRIDRYSEVMHLVSLVEGTLRNDVSLRGVCQADPLTPAEPTNEDRLCAAIAAVFPGGTITGAPKPRTMEIIDQLEQTRRGPYTGSMAVIGFDDRAILNIIIRTIVRWNEEFHLRVGAGIVHDSDPHREYEETMAKARALITALDEALASTTQLEVSE